MERFAKADNKDSTCLSDRRPGSPALATPQRVEAVEAVEAPNQILRLLRLLRLQILQISLPVLFLVTITTTTTSASVRQCNFVHSVSALHT